MSLTILGDTLSLSCPNSTYIQHLSPQFLHGRRHYLTHSVSCFTVRSDHHPPEGHLLRVHKFVCFLMYSRIQNGACT